MTTNLVAACQFDVQRNNPFDNLTKARQLVFEAAAKGAKIIVLPELCVSGQFIKSLDEAADCSQTKDGYQTQYFLPITQRFNCHVIFGCVELYENNFYNSAIVVGPNGVEGITRKRNLEGNDYFWAKSGENLHPIVNTHLGRLGILINHDVMNNYRTTSNMFREGHPFYRKGSVDIIAVPINWTKNESYPSSNWMGLAESVGSNLIIANRVGQEKNIKFSGGSCIIDKSMKVWTNGSSFLHETVVGGLSIS